MNTFATPHKAAFPYRLVELACSLFAQESPAIGVEPHSGHSDSIVPFSRPSTLTPAGVLAITFDNLAPFFPAPARLARAAVSLILESQTAPPSSCSACPDPCPSVECLSPFDRACIIIAGLAGVAYLTVLSLRPLLWALIVVGKLTGRFARSRV